MNSIAAAAGIGFFFALLRCLRFSRSIAFASACFFGTSNAYLQCATDMLEPMVSVPLLLLAILIVLGPKATWWSPILAGALLGLSGAIYQLALSAGLLLAGGLLGEDGPFSRRIGRVMIAATSSAAIFALIVIITFRALGSDEAIGVIGKPTAAGLFGQADPRHLIGAIFGLANALAPLSNWRGASRLLHGFDWHVVYNITCTGVALALLALVVASIFQKAQQVPRRRQIFLAASAASLLTLWAFAGFWSATYLKIWVFSLPAFWALWAEGSDAGTHVSWKALLLSGLLGGVSLASAIVRSRVESPDLVAARELASLLGEDDLLIAPGWDNTTAYLHTLLRPNQPLFSMTDRAVACERHASCVLKQLGAVIDGVAAKGGRIYFYGLLELSPTDWNAWYGSALRIPYEDMEPYRGRALSGRPIAPRSSRLIEVPR